MDLTAGVAGRPLRYTDVARPALSADGNEAAFAVRTQGSNAPTVFYAGQVPEGSGFTFGKDVSGASAAQACPTGTYPAGVGAATAPSEKLPVSFSPTSTSPERSRSQTARSPARTAGPSAR